MKLLEKKEKMTAMLAPSFPIDFSYPEIVGQLKRLGFTYVVEVARGAMETNRQLLELIDKNPRQRYIASPCPSIARLIRNKYPQLKSFLAPVDSPMAQTARLVLKKYPGARPVFIGPCLAKSFEAQEDYPKLGIMVLTFKELKKALELKGIKNDPRDSSAFFDIAGRQARLYPISGGLAQSCSFNALLTNEEYDVISGLKKVKKSLEDYPKNKHLRALDILFCDGGCIAGPGINNSLSIEERRKKVIAHWTNDKTKEKTNKSYS